MRLLPSRFLLALTAIFSLFLCAPHPLNAQALLAPESTVIAGYVYLSDPSALDTRLPAFIHPAGAKPIKRFSYALAATMGDADRRFILPNNPFLCVFLKDPRTSAIFPLFVFPENSSAEKLSFAAQSVGMVAGVAEGVSLVATSRESLALAIKELPTIKGVLKADYDASISIALFAPFLEYLGNTLLTPQPAAPKSVATLLSAEILKESSVIQLNINPDLKPRRLDMTVQAKANTPLERFLNQPPPTANPLIRYLPADGPLRASFSLDTTLLGAVAQNALASIDPAQAAPLKERINNQFFIKGNGAVLSRTNDWNLLGSPASKATVEQFLKATQDNGLVSTSTLITSSSLALPTSSLVVVLGKQDANNAMQRCQALLVQDTQNKQPLLLLPQNATVEKFPVQQLFRTDQKPASLPSEQAVFSVCQSGDQIVLASRYGDVVSFVRRVVQLDATAAPLESQKTFVDGAHLYLDFLPLPNQPCYLTMRLGENRARLTLVLP